ncbi:MAG: CGNR zinc finger domain-containing protein [Gemmatimonadota bacterium]
MADPEFVLLGDAIWLDFVNTAATPPDARDLLPDPAAYHRWTKATKLAGDLGDASFEEMLRLRAQLVTLVAALDAGRQAPASVVQTINRTLAGSSGTHLLTRVGGMWRLQFTPSQTPSALDAIAVSVAGTLSDPTASVRSCLGVDCTLHFIDRSPDGNRRWCSLERCGQRLHVERRRSSRIPPVV